MGLLNDSAAWLNTKLGQAAGVSISYRRGSKRVEIAAADGLVWLADGRFAVNTDGGPKIVFGERQYVIVASALEDLGNGEDDQIPQEGDRIVETVNGIEMVFEVAQPGTGDPAVRPSDEAGRSCYRVNCKREE